MTDKLNPAPAIPDHIKNIMTVVSADRTEKQNKEINELFHQTWYRGEKNQSAICDTCEKNSDSINLTQRSLY